MTEERVRIASFYEFKPLERLESLRESLIELMERGSIVGSIIIAAEGFNATVAGPESMMGKFIDSFETMLGVKLKTRDSFHDLPPFKRRKVKIKPEIVTLRKDVDISKGAGTHVPPEKWNALISDPSTLVLDARNNYEYEVGHFRGAVDPGTESFGDLPDFIDNNLDPSMHKRVAMYCTGGIRCEKFAPYMKQLGFEEVFQLEGGILSYLERVPESESAWEGECFVFDERVSVDEGLSKGAADDPSFFKNRRSEGAGS